MELIETCKGGQKLCYEGHIYTKKVKTKSIIRWECVCRRTVSCSGTINTNHDLSSPMVVRDHCHKADPVQVEVVKLRNRIKKYSLLSDCKPSEILSETMKEVTGEVRARMGSLSTICRDIRRARSGVRSGETSTFGDFIDDSRDWTELGDFADISDSQPEDPLYPKCEIIEPKEMSEIYVKDEPVSPSHAGSSISPDKEDLDASIKGKILEQVTSDFSLGDDSQAEIKLEDPVPSDFLDSKSSVLSDTVALLDEQLPPLSDSSLSGSFNCNYCPFSTYEKMLYSDHLLMHVSTNTAGPDIESVISSLNEAGAEPSVEVQFTGSDLTNEDTSHDVFGTEQPIVFTEDGVNKHACPYCTYTTPRRYRLREHVAKHTGAGMLACTVCEFKAVRKDKFINHMRQKHSKSNDEINVEIRRVRGDDAVPKPKPPPPQLIAKKAEVSFSCPCCDYCSSRKYRLKIHLQKHVTAGLISPDVLNSINTFASFDVANESPTEVVAPVSRTSPTPTSSSGSEECVKCFCCEFVSSSKKELNHHLQLHMSDDMYHCPYCEYKASRRDKFKEHVSKHTGEGLYSCSECEFSTVRRYRLTEHMRKHTGNEFYCTDCDYKTQRKDKYKEHVRSKHAGLQCDMFGPDSLFSHPLFGEITTQTD